MPKAKATDSANIIVDRVEVWDIDDLGMFHKNPRVGNVEKIADSLDTSGQFKPIIVNVGTHTGRENEILAGNHTYLAAKRLGWNTIYVAFVDVDETTATKINLADNRTADEGGYDDTLLAELLASLPDISGTGFEQEEVSKLLDSIDLDISEAIEDAAEQLDEEERIDRQLREKETFDGSPLGEEPDPRDEEDEEDNEPRSVGAGKNLTEASEEIKGGYSLKNEIELTPEDYLGEWGIPRLRDDRLMTFDEIPDNLQAWAGSATKEWPDPDQWWLYNWGIDSTSGMRDISKVIISFYCWDDYFENWWHYPSRYAAKVLNSKIKYVLTPNFSMWSDVSRSVNLWSLYRSRWIGRYLQEVGLTVCPDINWPMGDRSFLKDQVLATLPDNPPLISMQVTTFSEEDIKKYGEKKQIEDVQTVFDTLSPDGLLLYGGKPGMKWFKKNIKTGCPIFEVETRLAKLSEQAKNRTKKKTI